MGWLNYDQSLAQARSLKRHLEAHGVKVSIELQRGSGASKYWGHDWFVGELSHHVASRRSQGATPFLNLIKRGRGGSAPLPPPLANGYGGFDEVYRIITMGLANHPGAGGPYTLGYTTVPKDQGRYYLWGTEYEGGMNTADWTPSFRSFMGRANAGIIDWLKTLPGGGTVSDRHHLEHADWAFGRKVDRTGYSREKGIAEIGAARATSTSTSEKDWFDMATESDLRRIVREELEGLWNVRVPLTGSAAETFGPDFRAAALLAYAAKGGFGANESTIRGVADLLGTTEDRIVAAVEQAQEQAGDPREDA